MKPGKLFRLFEETKQVLVVKCEIRAAVFRITYKSSVGFMANLNVCVGVCVSTF